MKISSVLLTILFFALPALKAKTPAKAIPDSLLTERNITRLYLAAPDSALTLLDEAEQRRLPGMEPFRIDLLRSMVYGRKNMYAQRERYIRRALSSDSVQLVPQRKLRALSQLTMALEQLNKYEESIRTANEALQLARQLQQSATESELLSIIGRIYVGMSRPDEGIDYMRQAINRLQDTKDVREMAQLSTAYGDLMVVLYDYKHLPEAIEAGRQRAEVIRRMSELPGPPPGYIDQQYGYLYSKMALFYLQNGEIQQAAEAYRNCLATQYAHSPQGQAELIPYLLAKGDYQEVLNINSDMYALMQGQDTINYRYLTILDRYAQAYRGMQRHAQADVCQRRVTVLTDSIYNREKASSAQEFAALFDTQEKEAKITQQKYELNQHRILTYGISFILLLCLIFLWTSRVHLRKIREQNRIIEEKNRTAIRRIDELLAQREQLRNAWRKELEQEEQKQKEQKLQEPKEQEESLSPLQLQNRYIFQKMENALLDGKDYLNPSYGRENLMELTRLNKNRLTDIIKECADTTPNTYINHLRIEYAVKLMKEHPLHTIESIAADSGFNSKNTFYTAFREVFDMTPNEYRNG